VELRSRVTTGRAATFREVISRVREVYHGPLTYSANWEDVQDTLIPGDPEAASRAMATMAGRGRAAGSAAWIGTRSINFWRP
jgi:hypothetical protein